MLRFLDGVHCDEYTSRIVTSDTQEKPSPQPSARRPSKWFWLIAIALFGVLLTTRVILARRMAQLPMLVELPAYSLTNEQGEKFGATNLRGKAYVANFVFTSCPVICPKLTKRMVQVQDRTKDLGDALRLVTITVDPENDTPEVLRAYSQKYGADPARWVFLTGPLTEIEPVVVKGFKMMMAKKEATPGLFEIVHGERLVLVDGKGFVRGFYEANDEGVDKLVSDARGLVD